MMIAAVSHGGPSLAAEPSSLPQARDSGVTETESPARPTVDLSQPIQRIAFGSCIRQDRPQPVWDAIDRFRPELMLLIGDNIYADTEDMEVMKAKYQMLGRSPGFARMRRTVPLMAVWDDHDFGVNDGGDDYVMRDQSQQIFCDFFELPADAPQRHRRGLYDSVTIGPEGQRVQIILLDTRYFRSPLVKRERRLSSATGPYQPSDDSSKTFLGEEQWTWLEEQLRKPADVRVLASSIQVVPTEHDWEYWHNLPHERERLFSLIAKTQADGVVFLSGDRHLAEISQLPAKESPVGYPLYDITSSALNQRSPGSPDEPNRYRVGENFLQPNFGTLTFDWDADKPTVQLSVHDVAGQSVRSVTVPLTTLRSDPVDAR